MAALPQSQAVTGELTESNEGLMRVEEGVENKRGAFAFFERSACQPFVLASAA